MKWHEHVYSWKAMAKSRHLSLENPHDCINTLTSIFAQFAVDRVTLANTLSQLRGELRWTEDKRPYYDVYPSVTDAFVNIDLAKIKGSQIRLPIPDLLVRFPVGKEFQASSQTDWKTKVRSFLVSETIAYKGEVSEKKKSVSHQSVPSSEHHTGDWTNDKRGLLISIDRGEASDVNGISIPMPIVRGVLLWGEGNNDVSIEDHLEKGRGNNKLAPVDEEVVTNVVRLIVALCLLKNNPDLIEQEPLEADRRKWEATHDPKYLEKAERRGTRRWSVGKHIEVEPGFRRPHFAIRWCGKGGTDPQIRPIKGCLVKRQKVEEIPTGYLDEDERGNNSPDESGT